MIGLRLLAVLVLVAINGFFAAAEYSLIAVRVSLVRQLVEQGNARARIVQRLVGQLDRVVPGVQVGITLTSLGLGALGEAALAQMLRPILDWLPGNRAAIVAHGIALALAFALLTILHVVLGELVPKTISLSRAARAALIIARPFSWYLDAFRPIIQLLEGMSRVVVRALGIKPQTSGHTAVHSAEELQIQIRQAREHGLLDPGEEHSLLGALELGELRVREIMVPRPDVHALSVDATLADTLALFATTQRSRLPVYQGTLDHILGLLHIKDVLWLVLGRERRALEGASVQAFELRRLLREMLIVPESKLVNDLLDEMRARHQMMAMVVDEFGSILGLVTIEDIVEQMVGEIHDEFDVAEKPLILGSGADAAVIFDGGIGLRDLETQYGVILAEDPAYSTLGGFVLAQLGFIPKGGEGFDYGGYRFTVMEMDRRRVAKVKLQRVAIFAESRPVGKNPPAATVSPAPSRESATGKSSQKDQKYRA